MEIANHQVQLKPFNDRKSQYIGFRFFGYNSPAAIAREVFKPSMLSASLVVSSQKKFSVLGLGFSWGLSQVGVFSNFYGLLCTALDSHLMYPRFGPNIFMKLGDLTSH